MSFNKYDVRTGLMALVLSPLAVSLGLIFSDLLGNLAVALNGLPVLTLALVWVGFAQKAAWPARASQIFRPIFFSFYYYMGGWIVIFGLNNYSVYNGRWGDVFTILTAPYFIVNLILRVLGNLNLFPVVIAAVTVVAICTLVITGAVCKKKIFFDKALLGYGLIFVGLSALAGFQFYDRGAKILGADDTVFRIEDNLFLYYYRPFSENNRLKKLDEPAAVLFYENYPRLDGATVAYPVYGALAQALYQGLDEETVGLYVDCSTTSRAYERLINGQIDIFFGAQPSGQQLEAARAKGLELSLTPIAKEAFVFFVNRSNPVNGLTLEQIQDIYQKKITNWQAVGGENEKIMPFQRPENSGSQTIMLAKVMGDKPLPAPLREELVRGMGHVINRVAAYRNYSSAVGYSFRYYATGLKPDDNIKLLAINGLEPTVANIKNGAYPFIADVYAVTAGPPNENSRKLIDWILSEQGQRFIETCGYVGR